MSRCRYCGVEISDKTEKCPLCQGVLEAGGKQRQAYPDIYSQRKRLILVRQIISIVAIAAIALCLYIDYQTISRMKWSFIASGGIILAWRMFLVMSDPNKGYRARIIHALFGCFAYLMLIDYVSGFGGWSLDIVLPGAMFLINFGLIFLMIYNHRSWQSYMIYQLGGIVLGLIPIILIYAGVVKHPILSELAFGSSVFLFICTLILGGTAARTELERRFYI